MVISSMYLFFPVSKKIFKLQLIYNKNCKIEHRILYNGHGGLGAGVIQDDKTSEVSLTARLIRKMLVKSIVTKYFSIVQILEPRINMGHMGQSIYEEDTNISIYYR